MPVNTTFLLGKRFSSGLNPALSGAVLWRCAFNRLKAMSFRSAESEESAAQAAASLEATARFSTRARIAGRIVFMTCPCTIRREMNEASPRKLIIAIDGPAGAGKSTIASRLARKLGYANLESGAMYRALALKAIENDISFDDENALDQLAQNSKIKIEPTLGGNRVLLDGRDVTQRVREEDVSQAASRVSVHPKVREWMVARQQELGKAGGVVMEGRDIGTKVFPHADVKIFLDADPVIREQRRVQQQHSRGGSAEAMAAELRERDRRDRTRANSPLVAAPDATVIDSTSMSEDDVLQRVEALVQRKMAG